MKIVAAVNAMISRPELITNSIQGSSSNEIFFVYNDKFKWSIIDNVEGIAVFIYTGPETIEELASIDGDSGYDPWESITFVRYSAKDIGTKEATETFTELLKVVKEKKFGVGDALDEIIKTASWQQLL